MRNQTSHFNRVRALRNRSIDRARVIWSELDYAQQRMFEIQTGLQSRNEVANLERMYAYRAHRH